MAGNEKAWLGMVPAIIKDFNDTETASVALIENLQREELSPIEEAMAYGKLLELHQFNTGGTCTTSWKRAIDGCE